MELFIIRDGQQTGPFSQETVQSLLNKGDLRPADMGWHKGLPAWLPLNEVLHPGAERPSEPPPVSGSTIRQRPITARQKALLQYLGAAFDEKATKEEAALAICEALENPKLTIRFAKWGEEKLRLHPTLFQEELDYRRATRISRFLELCQTEAAEVVKDVTKAHVQVLMESLDKRQPGWDGETQSALWDYLLPAVSENFPQLVSEEWSGKLKFGGTSKVAAAYAGTPGAGMLPTAPRHPNAFQAAARGLIYGLVTLGVVLAALHLFRDGGKDVVRNESKTSQLGSTPPSDVIPPGAVAVAAVPPAPAAEEIHPTHAPLIGADPNQATPVAPAAPAAVVSPDPAAAAATTAPAPAAAEPAPGSTPMAATANFTPAPPPPSGEAATAPTATPPAAPAATASAPSPVARNSALLTQRVTVQLQFGKVTLNPGTRVRLIAIEGTNARVNFNNNIVLVPLASTDIDPANTIVSAAAPAPTGIPAAPAAAPLPATATAPAAPGAPKGPSADL